MERGEDQEPVRDIHQLFAVRDELRKLVDLLKERLLQGPMALSTAFNRAKTELQSSDISTARRAELVACLELAQKNGLTEHQRQEIAGKVLGDDRYRMWDIVDKDEHDALIMKAILQNKKLSQAARTLKEERPTVFEFLCSAYRYDRERFLILIKTRAQVNEAAPGRASEAQTEADLAIFDRMVPNAKQFKDALRRKATEDMMKSKKTGTLNLQ